MKPTHEALERRIRALEAESTRRKQAEKALRDLTETMTLAQKMAGLGYWSYDLKTHARIWSDQMFVIFGFDPKHGPPENDDLKKIWHPDDWNRYLEGFQAALHGTPYDIVVRLQHPDGRTRFVHTQGHPRRDDAGNIVGLVGTSRDITEWKKTLEALRKSEENYRNLFENAVVGLYQSSPQGRFLSVNPAFAGMLGYTSPEELMQAVADIATQYYADPEDRRRFQERLEKSGHVENFEFQARRKDGSRIWVSNSTRAYFDARGNAVRYEGIVQDISERKRLEEELKASHQSFLAVLEGIDATLYVADMDTHEILFMNKHMKDAFGGDFTGRICHEAFRQEPVPCPHCTNSQLLDASGNPAGVCVWEAENPVTRRWYINSDRAIRWVDGRMVRLQIATDITRLKEMEQQRRRTEEQLRQSQKLEAVGTLAGGVAHEFNNILAIILGNAELALMEMPEQNPVISYLEEIQAASLRGRDIVKHVLSFARKAPADVKPIEIATVVKEAVKLMRATLPAEIEIRQDIACETERISADPAEIHQVLMNLATNGAQAMADSRGGRLKVGLETVNLDDSEAAAFDGTDPGKYIRLFVADTGKGIPSEHLDRIFEPFFTTQPVGHGTGMGLAVVHGIIKKMGGAVRVESTPGRGTRVEILLPLAEPRSIEAASAADPDLLKGTERILFVDDEAAIVTLVTRILGRQGYRVEACSTGVEALERFRKTPDAFDLVISDMAMPQMPGDRLVKALLKIRPDVPVILCTGHSDRMDEAGAKALGVAAYVMKPLVIRDLTTTVRTVLDAAKDRRIPTRQRQFNGDPVQSSR